MAEVKEGDLFRVEAIDWTGGQVSWKGPGVCIWLVLGRHLRERKKRQEITSQQMSMSMYLHSSMQYSHKRAPVCMGTDIAGSDNRS